MASFSVYQLLFQFVNYFSRNFDKLIIGHWISFTALGYYDKSYRLMQMPHNVFGAILISVLQPNFSQYQDNKVTMSDKYLRVVAFVAAISFPIGVTLCLCGPELIVLFYGAKWEPAIPCFQILALSIPLTMINSTTGAFYQASNATKYLFYVGSIGTVLSGMFLDSKAWWLFLLLAAVFALAAVIGYRNMDINEVLNDLEPTVIKQTKQQNREETFKNWIRTTEMP